MDASAWVAGSAGLGGLLVSLYGASRTRKTDKDNVSVRHIEIALEAQQEQIDRQHTRMIQQDTKIAEQTLQIEKQASQIRELHQEQIKCHQEKQMLTMELELLKRSM